MNIKTLFRIIFWVSLATRICSYGYISAYGKVPAMQFTTYVGWGALIVSMLWLSKIPEPEKPGQPKLDSYVEITHLRPCRNAKSSRNPYIGMSGRVTDVFEGGGFAINTGSAILVVTDGKGCKFKYLDDTAVTDKTWSSKITR